LTIRDEDKRPIEWMQKTISKLDPLVFDAISTRNQTRIDDSRAKLVHYYSTDQYPIVIVGLHKRIIPFAFEIHTSIF
jgi:hypothetical protein